MQRGDTLTVIARRFRTTVRAITERNQITDPDSLAEGQTLVIPEPSSLELVAYAPRRGRRLGVRRSGSPARSREKPSPSRSTIPMAPRYTGTPHVASPDGEVATTYKTSIGPGVYGVVAEGGGGTSAEIRFHVDPGRG